MKFAFFPGCSLLSSAAEYAASTHEVCERLGVELEELEGWVCCGATPAHVKSRLLSIALPMISCASAEKMGLNILTCCAACQNRLKTANHEVCENATLRGEINELIEENYRGTVRVYHLLEMLSNEIGSTAVAQSVEQPLTGLKVAPYYGCLMARMPEALRVDAVENPVMLDELFRAAGADIVQWPYKTECCGASMTLASTQTVVRLSGDILRAAKRTECDCVVVVCPLCQANLDMYQGEASARMGEPLNVPILYFTQLLGLALGVEPARLGFNRLIANPASVLAKVGVDSEEIYL